jgi:hypothetical protein
MEEINSYSILLCSELHNVNIDEQGQTYSLKVQTNLSSDTYTFNDSRFFNFNQKDVLSLIPYNQVFLREEMDDYSKVESAGQYYVDYVNGKIWSYSSLSGAVELVFANFPFYPKVQKVKINLAIDGGFDSLTKEKIEEESGIVKEIVLNKIGSNFYKQLFKSNPIYWGV